MQRAQFARGAFGAALLLGACDGATAMVDAGPCWPLNAEPGGEVQLGTGDISFEPLPGELVIVRDGSQSDPFIQLHSRVRGLPPGNPKDIFDPRNPKTKVSAVIGELGLTLGYECPASIGYVPAPEGGAFDLLRSLRLGFGTFPIDDAVGKQARVTIEVVGSNGVYARDEKMVTLVNAAAVTP